MYGNGLTQLEKSVQHMRAALPKSLLTPRPRAYVLGLIAVVLVAAGYSQRHDGIFACGAAGYGADRYLAYCQATGYGDYDHGAFWFNLESDSISAASTAQVLVLGNSRTQIGFSSPATEAWFSAEAVPYYLLGFSHNGNVNFTGPLLARLGVRPKVYVVNTDLFFESRETPPARTVMHDGGARKRYAEKRTWQRLHRTVCTALPLACADEPAFFRSRPTGAWIQQGGRFTARPVSYDSTVDQDAVRRHASAASGFLDGLPVPRECVILTIVPNARTGTGTAHALAAALGRELIDPRPAGLVTYDGSHLDPPSAQRWSEAFFRAAGPRLRSCLGNPAATATPALQ